MSNSQSRALKASVAASAAQRDYDRARKEAASAKDRARRAKAKLKEARKEFKDARRTAKKAKKAAADAREMLEKAAHKADVRDKPRTSRRPVGKKVTRKPPQETTAEPDTFELGPADLAT